MRKSTIFALLAFLAVVPGLAAAQDFGYDPRPFDGAGTSADGSGDAAVAPDEAGSTLSFPTITYQRTTKSVPSSLCASVPAATTTFASTDAAAYLYFRISGFQSGESLSVIWWDPSGEIHHRGSWAPLSTSNSYYCLEAHISIAGTSAASKPGTWRVQVFSDKIFDVPYVDLTFTVSSSGGGTGFPTITNARTAKSVPQGACTPLPTLVTTFAPTDERAYVFFNISGHASGETLTRVWYAPDGSIAASGSWSPLAGGTSYCLAASLTIAGTVVASTPGTWRVRVYSDKILDVPYLDLPFTISSGGGSGFPTITNARTAKSVPANQACTPLPTATSSFSSTDASVYLWFQISGHADGERLSRVWYSPDGKVHATGQWDPLPAGGAPCKWAALDIAGKSPASKPGTWRVQVFSDRIFDVPYVDKTFTITSGGGGGFTVAGTWLLTSSARVQGAGAFWKTDLSVRNKGTSSASAIVKFLGNSGDGRGGPERSVSIPAGQTVTWRDVLGTLFGLTSDFGPILVRASTANLAILGQTWTAGGAGTYGQSVPVLSTDELIGSTPKSILGVRQDAFFRTNLMLANANETTVAVTVQLVSTAGAVLKTLNVSLGPLSRAQYNVGEHFGYTNLSDAAFVISSPTAGARVGAYASVIDAGTADPRTLLPR
ncbi:MAG: hypothetical protein ACYC4P_15980 [Thermoanaerobaculia bacterium]